MPVFRAQDFVLGSGAVLHELEIAYEGYGHATPDSSNVILVTHGITSSHHAAGNVTPDRRSGWWDEIIGHGKLFDTTRYCIISSNMLGSCYGSTGPSSINPHTGKQYGLQFPDLTFEDIVRAQHLLLRSLGISNLVAVAGSSLGGYQAFQWSVTFPDYMTGVIVMDTAPRDLFDSATSAARLLEEFSQDPNWNNGDYYASAGLEAALTAHRIYILKSYGFEEQLEDITDASEREALLERTAREWAREFDANSLIVLRRATARYNVEGEFHKVRAKLFYILADTDEWFPSNIGPDVMTKLSRAGVDATFFELKSRHGHYATIVEPEKWVPEVKRFLAKLEAAPRR